MTRSRIAALALVLALAPVALRADEVEKEPRVIDLAICLDTSGSMKGLLDSARHKIWSIVNDLALAKPLPRLRVAFLTFGNNGHDEKAGWVRVHANLTEDLDLISQEMFAQVTNGGNEYVGRVLQRAFDELRWDPRPETLRLVIVAGNESAAQDPEVDYRGVCKQLISKGIMVNSIYCGPAADEIAPGWREVALLADGHFASIDQEQGAVTVSTPFDSKLAELSTALNATYVPFGREGGRAGCASRRRTRTPRRRPAASRRSAPPPRAAASTTAAGASWMRPAAGMSSLPRWKRKSFPRTCAARSSRNSRPTSTASTRSAPASRRRSPPPRWSGASTSSRNAPTPGSGKTTPSTAPSGTPSAPRRYRRATSSRSSGPRASHRPELGR
ncbi:MAG: VWA domain-containing protein [Planctomycetes bacterium]|nr:VWA domain-containing protein [Planctomycetota bacterium]